VGKIDRFEDLIVWRKAGELTRAIYAVTSQEGVAKDFGLSGQIQRAAVSVISNVAEGFERNRCTEFHELLSTARASCAEVIPNSTLLSISATSTRLHSISYCIRPRKATRISRCWCSPSSCRPRRCSCDS